MKKQILNNGLENALGGNSTAPQSYSPLLDRNGLWYNINAQLITLNGMMLNNAYKCYGLIQTFIDLPVEDAFKGGVIFTSQQLKSEELEDLNNVVKRDYEEIKNAIRWQRLFGGGILWLDDGNGFTSDSLKYQNKLDPKTLYKKRFSFMCSDRWEMQKVDGSKAVDDTDFLLAGKARISKTRCFALIGKEPPYYTRIKLAGWGLSILEQVLPFLNTYMKSLNVIFELIDEAKIDICKFKNLATTLSQPSGEAIIQKRLSVASQGKNYKSLLAMDSEDDYQQKQITFGGYGEILKFIMNNVSANLRIPVSKIFGIGSSGFSSGEDDLENYNNMIESEVRNQAYKLVLWVGKMRCWQLFGQDIEDLDFEWQPLRTMTAEQDATIKSSSTQQAIAIANSLGLDTEGKIEFFKKLELIDLDNDFLEAHANDLMVNDEYGNPETNQNKEKSNKFDKKEV